MQNPDMTEEVTVAASGELTFASVAAIDREMRTLRARLNDLEARKASLLNRLLAVLVAKSLTPDRAGHRPSPATSGDGASAAVISAPPLDTAARSFVRPPRSIVEGRVPYGFATRVRMLAHRSIALANRPLERAEIIEDIVASGTPLPATFLPQKVSRVLTRDDDLVNTKGVGYALTDAALMRERRLIREEEAGMGRAPTEHVTSAAPDDEDDDATPGSNGP